MRLWCDEQITVSIDGPEGQREIRVPAPLARIGAHPESDIVLIGAGVAKRAFYLHATSAGIYCLSLDIEEGNLEERARWLNPQDALTVGPYRLTARTQGALIAPPERVGLVLRGSSPPPLPVLNIYCGNLLKDKRRFRSQLSVLGRRPQCALQLRGARVSSFHCALFWEQRRLWCIDLLSSNGTQLNGAPLRCEEVRLNDRLEIGEFGLAYHRWSPRSSMSPGWQPSVQPDAPDDEPLSSSDALAEPSAVSGESPAATDSSMLRSASHSDQQLREQLAEEIAQLANQRRDLERRWAEASDQIASRIGQLQAEALKLSEERASLESARAELQSERQSRPPEFSSRSGLVLDSSLPPIPQPVVPQIDGIVPEMAGGEPLPADDPAILDSAPDDERAVAVPTPPGRRGKPARHELTTFVSDRLSEIEQTKRRKALVLWTAVGAAALTLSAVILGVWTWFY